jgi:Ca-activated chloride channel homolog
MQSGYSLNRSVRLFGLALGQVLSLVLLLGMAIPVSAQVTLPPVVPRPTLIPPPPARNQVIVELHAVEAVVEGPVANVSVTQIFRNDSGRIAEGIYLFPLPKDAAVSDFQMMVDGETLEGKLLDRDEARRIYEEIVRRQRDPALLEYLDRGLFQANVFPIPPGERRSLNFTYTQVLEQRDGLYRYNYPLRTRQYSVLPPERVSVSVELRDQEGLRTIYSPEYPIRIERMQDDTAIVTFEGEGEQPPADFNLYFGTDESAIGLNLLSYKPAGDDGYFALLAAPSVEVENDEVVARDVVLVVDISGSMKGDKMEQARAAARYVVEALNPDDRFAVVAFSSASEAWAGELQPAGEKNRADALAWIDDLRANGSTDINRALLEALALLAPDANETAVGRPGYVLFLTDGQPTLGETSPERIVANAQNNIPLDRSIRFFPFGIGYDVNTDLLDTLGNLLGGRSNYVQPDERIDEAVGTFYAQISTPVLANIALDFGDTAGVTELFPYPLPDLFAGEQLVAVGRYREGGAVDVELEGDVNGATRLYVYPERSLVTSGGEPFVARLWATRRIGALIEQVRRSGPQQELIDEIVDLSLRYGIVTPYTSYLVLEPGELAPQPLAADGSNADLYAPRAIASDAQKGVAAAAAEAAAAAPSGAAAVQASVERSALQSATTVTQEEAVRYVAGRSFQRQGSVVGADGQPVDFWVDTAFRESMEVTAIRFGSDAYFALLDRPGIAEWLAIGPEIVIVTSDNSALRITTLE